MDLETENRIAVILMKEAAELRRQAEKDGVHVYLQQPKPRVRPNPRFLAATILGVQQANRAVEVNEMWRLRQKERELDHRLEPHDRELDHTSSRRHAGADASSSSSKAGSGLRDEEVESFLQSRTKRGRGSVGSRMDETGPYLPRSHSDSIDDLRINQRRPVHGPEKPRSSSSSKEEEESEEDDRREKKRKRVQSESEKHRSKSGKKKKRKEEKRRRSKHRK